MEETSVFGLFSMAVMLFLVLDPVGNLPVFVSILKRQEEKRYCRIILRESTIALAVLIVFLLFGENILKLLQVSQNSVGIGGGVILLLISLKMVFGAPVIEPDSSGEEREPFIVPLAIPLIAGPSAIAMTILVRGNHSVLSCLAALLMAWGAATLLWLTGRLLAKILGNRALDALESLMGFLLTIMSVEMLINGIRAIFVA